MFKISELRHKDVINEADGKKLGYAYDIELDAERGILTAIVLPGESRFLGFFIRKEDTVIPWERIRKIGVDVLLIGDERERLLPSPDAVQNKAASTGGGTVNWDDWEI